MAEMRYEIDQEKADKWLIEEMMDSIIDTEDAVKVTVTDTVTGKSAEAVGGDYEEALERACDKLGISVGDLDEEVDSD